MNQLKRTNIKVDKDHGKELNKGNVWSQKCCQFSSNEFWKSIGRIVSAPNFGFGGSRLW